MKVLIPAKCGSSPRKGRNVAIGQAVRAGQPHIQRPLPLLAPAIARQSAFGVERLPALRGHLVEVGVMPARSLWLRPQTRLARSAHGCERHLWYSLFV